MCVEAYGAGVKREIKKDSGCRLAGSVGRGAQVETLPPETDGKPGGEWEGMNRRV